MTNAVSIHAHIEDDELEKYFLGMIADQSPRERIEIHLLICSLCTLKADWTRAYVLAMKEPLLKLHDPNDGSSDD